MRDFNDGIETAAAFCERSAALHRQRMDAAAKGKVNDELTDFVCKALATMAEGIRKLKEESE